MALSFSLRSQFADGMRWRLVRSVRAKKAQLADLMHRLQILIHLGDKRNSRIQPMIFSL
jgi:hypothetical protein